MHSRELLEQWLWGTNIHVKEPHSECCPDFACCNSDNHWPSSTRARFIRAVDEHDTHTVNLMLYMAVQGLYASRGIIVHIEGEESGNA